jgi:hypothetical protein
LRNENARRCDQVNGSGIFQAAGTANVRNCIIVGNTGGGGDEVSGSFVSQGHNVIGQGTDIGHTGVVLIPPVTSLGLLTGPRRPGLTSDYSPPSVC